MTNSQLDTTNESQEVSPFPAGDHKAHINRRAQRHRKHKTEKKPHKGSTKEVPPWKGQFWVHKNVSFIRPKLMHDIRKVVSWHACTNFYLTRPHDSLLTWTRYFFFSPKQGFLSAFCHRTIDIASKLFKNTEHLLMSLEVNNFTKVASRGGISYVTLTAIQRKLSRAYFCILYLNLCYNHVFKSTVSMFAHVFISN